MFRLHVRPSTTAVVAVLVILSLALGVSFTGCGKKGAEAGSTVKATSSHASPAAAKTPGKPAAAAPKADAKAGEAEASVFSQSSGVASMSRTAAKDQRESQRSEERYDMDNGTPAAPPDMATAQQIAKEAKAPEVKEQSGSSDESEPAPINEKLIRTATITVEVEDVGAALKSVRATATKFHGYVGQSDIQGSEGNLTSAHLIIKIPSKHYDEMLVLLVESELGHVISQSEKVDDVTEEWIDVDARLRTLKEQREELRKQLQRAPDMATFAQLQREIQTVQQQIEQGEGRLKYLGAKVSYSTIDLTLAIHQNVAKIVQQEREADKWSAGGTMEHGWAVARRLTQRIFSILVMVLSAIPCWGPPLLLVWYLVRRARSRASVVAPRPYSPAARPPADGAPEDTDKS